MKEKKRLNVECGRSGVVICYVLNMICGFFFIIRFIFRNIFYINWWVCFVWKINVILNNNERLVCFVVCVFVFDYFYVFNI